jgi:CubicO group peptidase (beta-lactamase class C family)
MSKMHRFFLLFFLAVCTQVSALDWFNSMSSKALQAQTLLEGFDEVVEDALKEYQVPGLAIGVVVDGQVIYAKGFGFRDVDAKTPVTPETLFAIGSCTKAFTTFTAGCLVDEGVIAWDQLMIDVLPEFRLWDQYATQNLTIRDLLTHRSGLPRHDFMWYNSKISRAELMKRIRYLKPSFDIRERYQYNNLMYFSVGYAMEQVTGKTWEELVANKILKPLGMNDTNFSIEDIQKSKNFAWPYIEKNDVLKKLPFRDFSVVGPAGSMNSCVHDLTRWLEVNLNGGTYNGKSLISPSTLQEMHAPQVVVPGAPESKETLLYAYGIGWSILSYRGQYYVSHDGGLDGFTSVVGFLPNEGIGVVVLANKNLTSLPRYVSFEILDRILQLPKLDWLKDGLEGLRRNKETKKESQAREDMTRKKGTSPSHSLEEYVGEYDHPGYGKINIQLADGKLQVVYNDIASYLEHWHYDIFVLAEETQDLFVSLEGTKFIFHNNLNGDIDALDIPFEPNAKDIHFTRRPEEKLSTLNYLSRFVGSYEIYGYTVDILIRDQTLCALIPSQPIYELVPNGENEFTVKSMTGYNVRFVLDELGQVEEILLIQPYGTFSAKPKKC